MKNFYAITILALLLTACVGNAPTQTDSDAVGTIVAGTLTAFPSATPVILPSSTTMVEPTVTFTPEPPSVLPRDLYYLVNTGETNTGEKISQIYRLGMDGKTVTQITNEESGVTGFDISPVDGIIAYASYNRLIAVDPNGENHRVLVENLNSDFIGRPVWSPDGKLIAYSGSGDNIYLYTVATGNSAVILPMSKMLNPELFSPDSKKLIIRESGILVRTVKIYDFASNTLKSLSSPDDPYPCFETPTWFTSDSFYCSFHLAGLAASSMPGLWRVNANDGSVETLINSRTPPFQLVTIPHQDSAGNLYYLYGEDDGLSRQGKARPSLSLVRSDLDGVSNRIVLRPETFQVSHAIWTPDNKAIVVEQLDEKGAISSELILVPVDQSLPIVTLPVNAKALDRDGAGENPFCWGT